MKNAFVVLSPGGHVFTYQVFASKEEADKFISAVSPILAEDLRQTIIKRGRKDVPSVESLLENEDFLAAFPTKIKSAEEAIADFDADLFLRLYHIIFPT